MALKKEQRREETRTGLVRQLQEAEVTKTTRWVEPKWYGPP